MLGWLKAKLLPDVYERMDVLVEDAHCRVDEHQVRLDNIESRLDIIEANVVVHRRPKNYTKNHTVNYKVGDF